MNFKCTITLILVAVVFTTGQAQSTLWKETFKQKKTQREYLAKQIALLQVYLGYVKDGYNIVSRGWTTVEHIRNGEVSLHRDFFSSLKKVNPHIANSVKVVDIIAFQTFIINELRRTWTYCRNNEQFTPKEVLYVYNVYHNMIFLSDANISELIRITSSGEAEMNDAARIQNIDALYKDSLDKMEFVQSFSNDTRLLGALRQQESSQNNMIGKQYGI